MASNFFPMLSSSPPPIDDDYFDDDDDDEFGAFKAADSTLECSSSFDIPDHNEAPVSHVPELHSTRSCDARRNVCSENGINGEFSVFPDCTLLHKKEKVCHCQDVAVGYCSCDSCVFSEALDTKLTLVDRHSDSVERVDGEAVRFRRHSVDSKTNENLGTYSGETEASRLGSQKFHETSLHSGDNQSRTKDLDSSHGHSLDPSFINCVNNLSPKLLFSQRESSPVSSIDDGLPPDVCDDSHGESGVISGTVSQNLLHQKITRTSNSLDDVSCDYVDKNISEDAVSDMEDYQSKFVLFSAKQGELFVDGEISETVIDSPSLNLSDDVQSLNSRSLLGRSVNKDHLEDPTSTHDSEDLQEADVCLSRIPVLDHLGSKLSRATDDYSLSDASNVQPLDFVSEETFSRCLAETPDEFDDFQQAEFVHYDHPASEGNGVYCEENSFSDTASAERSDVKYPIGAFSHSVRSQEHENYQAQCAVETSASERSAGDFRTEDPLSASGFADFESASFDHQNEMPSESIDTSAEDSFADFESAASLKAHSILEPHSLKSSKDSDKGIGKISAVISAIFPVSEDAAPSGIAEEKREIWEHNPKSNRLWDKLHEIEQTPGLRFQWGVSHSFQLLLRSVNVDYHSILRTSSVPFFASGLSLLEPTKGPVQTAAKVESEEKSQSRKDLAIPPVQFDWSSSGLVNPLDSTQATSTLMDLSFLSPTESNSPHLHMSSDFGLESEFLQSCCPASPTESNIKPPILQQLLSSTAVSSLPDSSQSYRPSSMSQEAIHVLDQLPDLSFMRAKVLMFPVSSNT